MKSPPSIFLSHGPPFIAQAGGMVVDFFRKLGRQLERPEAILCVSAHWETVHPKITGAENPGIIHDFGGPPGLFQIDYPVNGRPALAEKVRRLLEDSGFHAEIDSNRGLDHGVWIPLMFMYPEGDIPVIQLSLQTEETPLHHFRIGSALKPLREEGVMIIGSGGAVHNLDEIHRYKMDAKPPNDILAFDQWLRNCIENGGKETLMDYKKQAPEPEKCHPYPAEHLLPLYVCLGSADDLSGELLYHGFLFGTLGMAAYQWC